MVIRTKKHTDDVTMKDVRCPDCNKKACEAYGEVVLKVICPRCGTEYTFESKGNW